MPGSCGRDAHDYLGNGRASGVASNFSEGLHAFFGGSEFAASSRNKAVGVMRMAVVYEHVLGRAGYLPELPGASHMRFCYVQTEVHCEWHL